MVNGKKSAYQIEIVIIILINCSTKLKQGHEFRATHPLHQQEHAFLEEIDLTYAVMYMKFNNFVTLFVTA